MNSYKLYKLTPVLSFCIILFGSTALPAQDCHISSDKIFTRTDILAYFKGGPEKWFEFAQKEFDFRSVAQNLPDSIQQFHDSIIVKFVVTRSGKVCQVSILRGNGLLSDAAVKLLKSSPDWVPASSEGRYLNAYRAIRIEISIDRQRKEYKVVRNFNSYYDSLTEY
jgi:hypothetical protein